MAKSLIVVTAALLLSAGNVSAKTCYDNQRRIVACPRARDDTSIILGITIPFFAIICVVIFGLWKRAQKAKWAKADAASALPTHNSTSTSTAALIPQQPKLEVPPTETGEELPAYIPEPQPSTMPVITMPTPHPYMEPSGPSLGIYNPPTNPPPGMLKD